MKEQAKEMWRSRFRGWRTAFYAFSVTTITTIDMITGQIDLKDVAHKLFPGYEIEGVVLVCTLITLALRIVSTTPIFKPTEENPPPPPDPGVSANA